jgi:formate hydrogenlyase subunit 6/NADH:ubiquinone oxidoreductase subunit I
MCATFCPTGAITKYDDPVTTGTDKPMGIEHYPAACVQCRLCEDICLTKAVHIDSNVSTKALLEGEILRYPMKPLSIRLNQPDQIYRRMYDLLGGGQIYDYGGDNSRPD